MTQVKTNPLAEQAEALAREMWVTVDWLDAAEEAAMQKPGAIGVPLSLIGEATAAFRAKVLTTLQRVRDETWEQAIDEVARSLTGSVWHQKRVIDRLRARAATLQEIP